MYQGVLVMFMWHIFFALFLLLGLSSCTKVSPATYIGNGTTVVVCRDTQDQIHSIELLDSFEAKQFQKTWKLDHHFLNSTNFKQTLRVFLNKLSYIDSTRAELYLEYLSKFDGERAFVDGLNNLLNNTNDDFSPIKIKGESCKKEALISQNQKLFLGKQYVVNKDLFNHPLLSNGQRALALLHEFIYRELILEGGAGNSLPVRGYVSFLASETFGYSIEGRITDQTRKRYLDKTKESGFWFGEWKGLKVELNTFRSKMNKKAKLLQFCPNGHIYRAYVADLLKDISTLTQWSCEDKNIEAEGLREKDLPPCKHAYCSSDKSFILKQQEDFALFYENAGAKEKRIKCAGEFSKIRSLSCGGYEHNPLDSEFIIDSFVDGSIGICRAELKNGRWATINFIVRCEK